MELSDELKKTDVSSLIATAEHRTKGFSDLLAKLSKVNKETKVLWIDIYENAIQDRMNSYLLFADLLQHVLNQPQGHMNHGKLLATYVERMNKSNDQLIRLAELVEKALTEDEAIDVDALYEEFDK